MRFDAWIETLTRMKKDECLAEVWTPFILSFRNCEINSRIMFVAPKKNGLKIKKLFNHLAQKGQLLSLLYVILSSSKVTRSKYV